VAYILAYILLMKNVDSGVKIYKNVMLGDRGKHFVLSLSVGILPVQYSGTPKSYFVAV
jgi:hypothetical protein